jgi:hypothetical protein
MAALAVARTVVVAVAVEEVVVVVGVEGIQAGVEVAVVVVMVAVIKTSPGITPLRSGMQCPKRISKKSGMHVRRSAKFLQFRKTAAEVQPRRKVLEPL